MDKKNIVICILIILLAISLALNITKKSPPKVSPSSKKPYITPTTTFMNPQTYGILSWKKYSSSVMGLSFDYPDNLDHAYPEGANPSALKEASDSATVLKGMSGIFSVKKIITKDDVETWWKKYNAQNNNGDGLMPAVMMKTFFQNKTAYYFAVSEEQQVPSDYYIIPFQGYLLKISFIRYKPLKDVINSACNKNGECDPNVLYLYKDDDESFFRFDNLIVDRILSSIRFSN